jgi:hypothetical protein
LSVLGLCSSYIEDEDFGLHLPQDKASPLLDSGRNSELDEDDPQYRAAKNRARARHTRAHGHGPWGAGIGAPPAPPRAPPSSRATMRRL